MLFGPIARPLIFVLLAALAIYVPVAGQPARAAETTLQLTPMADARANSAQPDKSVPDAPRLFVGAEPGSEAYLKFDTSGWVGQPYAALTLQLDVRNGSTAGLAVRLVSSDWAERRLNWTNRPRPGTLVTRTASAPAGTLNIDVSGAYADSTVAGDRLSLRLTSASSAMIDFSSSEGAAPPRLIASPVVGSGDPSPAPSQTPTPAPSVPEGLTGNAIGGRYVELAWLPSTASVDGTVVYRLFRDGWWIGSRQPELTYTDRPDTAGTYQYQVRAIDAEGNQSDLSPPISVDVVESTATAAPTTAPTAAPTAEPSQSPGATSVPTTAPSPTPSATSAPTPAPSPAPDQLYRFTGRGTDHGAGMSQYGARGRAAAGQTFDRILTHYYAGTTIDVVDGQAPLRVLLAANFKPTGSKPARVTAVSGGWTSPLFGGATFGPGTYAEMWPPTIVADPPAPEGHWVVIVRDGAGTELGRATAPELLMEPANASTILNISFKDWHANYTQFRGGMRLTVTASGGLRAVNVVPVDQYLYGVVPSEVIPSWPIEAIKAQAVAARSFAWPKIGKVGPYDVTPSSSSNQVYRGVLAEHPRTTAAVNQTAGAILRYNGNVITAYYHTASGGYTENSEYVWPGAAGKPGRVVGYIRGRPDVDENGVAYDKSYGKFSYASGAFTMSQLSKILAKSSKTNVGQLQSITFERGVSDRVYRVTLVGSATTKKVSGAIFKNVYNRNRLSGPAVNSTMYWLVLYSP